MIPALSMSFSQSSSFRFPVRRDWESTWDSREKRRFTSCSFDISRLKDGHRLAALEGGVLGDVQDKGVFPMEGLAATRMKSEGCRPDSL